MSTDQLLFCPCCFATNEDGSWQHTVDENMCSNCGAINSAVMLPRWAVESIRQQASWVGKRYYPNEEDYEKDAERRALLDQVTTFPGRSVKRGLEPGTWMVEQRMPEDKQAWTTVTATSAKQALAKARYTLTYVAQEQLDENPRRTPRTARRRHARGRGN